MLWFAPLLLFVALAAPAAAAPVAYDLDGDLAFDTAEAGDWDDDGVLETDDVQAAVAFLNDTGPKTVHVLPGVYQPPAQAPPAPGLIRLPDRTTLACDVGAVLLGLAAPPLGPDASVATLTNADHVNGNSHVTISGCEITGGMPASYDSTLWAELTRMGVYFHTVTSGRVEDSRIHDTLHSCLYAKNSRHIVFADNVLEDCGGYHDLTERPGKPAVYLYATTSGTTEDVQVFGNIILRSGGSGLNLRRNTTDDRLLNVLSLGNWIEDTADGTDCIAIRGVDGITVQGDTCRRTGPLGTAANALAFFSDAAPHVDSVRDLTIRSVRMLDVRNGAGVYLRGYVEDATLIDVTVEKTQEMIPCAQIKTPFRNVSIDGLVARECGGEGILQEGCAACGEPGVGLELRNLEISGADVLTPLNGTPGSGVRFSGPIRDLVLENAVISGVSGSGVDLGPASLIGGTLRDVTVDGVPRRYLGRRTAASLPPCVPAEVQSWAVVFDAASASTCAGGGGYEHICRCSDGAWRRTGMPASRYGVYLRNGASDDVLMERIQASNFEASYSIRVDGSPADVSILAPGAVDDSNATPTGMLGAVDASADTFPLSVSGASCSGTNPGAPCVRTNVAYPDLADPDGDGIGTQCDLACADGVDNDLNGKIDYPADPGCSSPADRVEKKLCGLGFELALLAPLLARLRRLRTSAAR